MPTASLNDDFERRSLWSATMPRTAGSIGSAVAGHGRLWSSSAAATPGSPPLAELARRGVAVTLLEAETLGWGASTRNGGIVHPGYKWGPRQLVAALRRGRPARRCTTTRWRLRDRQAADRRGVDRLRLPRESATSSSPTPRRMSATSSSCARAWLAAVSASTFVPREKHPRRDRLRCLSRGARHPRRRPRPPGPLFAGLAAAADRAGADLHEGVRARTVRRQADGRFTVETERGAILARDVADRHERLHRRRRPGACGAGSSRSGATSSPPSRCPTTSSPNSRPRAGRSSTRRTSCTTGTSRPTGGWSSVAGRACCRRSIDRTARILYRRAAFVSTRSSRAGGSTTRGAATSASRSTGCRMSGGRRMASPTRWAAAGRASRS